MHGAVLTFVVAGGAALAAWTLAAATARLGIAGLLVDALALKLTLSARGLAARANLVARELERGDLGAARAALGYHLVSRPTAELDEALVASAAIESVAENLTDALVAPLLFYVACGLPGAVGYRVVNTADAMIGYRGGVLEHFGKTAARLDDVLNILPARLAAAAIVMAAPIGGGRAGRALVVAWRDHAKTASPNAGWTMAAMAGALGVWLVKQDHYRLGEGASARAPTPADLRTSVRVMGIAAAGVVLAAAASRWILR